MTDRNEEKDEVLRKIGRNVVILQKLEGMLKRLVLLQGATISVDQPEKLRKRAEAIAKRPLGHVVSEFLRDAYPSAITPEPESSAKAHAAISLSFTLDPERSEEHASTLYSVVSERNNLIHQMLLTFDPESPASCQLIEAQLDAQLLRVEPEYRFMQALLVGLKESFEAIHNQIKSDEPGEGR